MLEIEPIRYIDIIAGIVVVSCLALMFMGRDGETTLILIGVLAALGLYEGTRFTHPKNKK